VRAAVPRDADCRRHRRADRRWHERPSLPADDEASLAEALVSFLADPEAARAIGARARKRSSRGTISGNRGPVAGCARHGVRRRGFGFRDSGSM
jgi:hypothetical protein